MPPGFNLGRFSNPSSNLSGQQAREPQSLVVVGSFQLEYADVRHVHHDHGSEGVHQDEGLATALTESETLEGCRDTVRVAKVNYSRPLSVTGVIFTGIRHGVIYKPGAQTSG